MPRGVPYAKSGARTQASATPAAHRRFPGFATSGPGMGAPDPVYQDMTRPTNMPPPPGRAASRLAMALGLLLAPACSEEKVDVSQRPGLGDACDPADDEGRRSSCTEELRCEARADEEGAFVCAEAIEVRGRVIDALDAAPIEGALVYALDASSTPVTDIVATDADGRYTLAVPVPRLEDGSPAPGAPPILLGASAADYLRYPEGLRPALPVVVDDPEASAGIENATTTLELIPLPEAQRGGVTVRGRVLGDPPRVRGALIVAEQAGDQARIPVAIADLDGDYALFNVPPGEVTVRGYRGGVQIEAVQVEVGDDALDGVDLELADLPLATVSGSVNIVDAPGGARTSVVLVPAALYRPELERGPVPLGLRAPSPGVAPDVSGAWSIGGVPSGSYRVLAAFENDGLVRDPDPNIAGTDVPLIEVSNSATVGVDTAFKVTGALAVVGPGAEGLEAVSGAPTFEFEADASEDGYEIVVYDALGREIWRDDAVPAVTGSPSVQVDYGGEALEPGMIYQFRATSFRERTGDRTPLSRTEDLRGVFEYTGG